MHRLVPRSRRGLLIRGTAVAAGVALCTLIGAGFPAQAATADSSYSVSIVAVPQTPHTGEKFDIKGVVTPAAAGGKVRLQRFFGGMFQTIATDRLDAQSAYAFSQTAQLVGGHVYRVVKARQHHIHKGISPQKRVFITGDTLRSGPRMEAGDSLISSGGSYQLTMQTTGNLALSITATGRVIWSMGTSGHPGAWAVLQPDGNLVVHAADGTVLKTTGTGGNPKGSYGLRLREDSNLAIYNPGGNPFWLSFTTNPKLAPGESLKAGQFLSSADRHYQVVMRDDGNLVLYDTYDGSIDWASNTAVPGSRVFMQAQGNMLIIGPFGRLLWSSHTNGFPGATAVLQNDGNLVIWQNGVARWASKGIGGVLGDDYPAYLRDAKQDSLIDPWRFYNRECTSFVAWRMNSANNVAFSNFMEGGHFGNAGTWDDNARALGYVVNSVPARGAIAESDKQGSAGHVAWVAAVGDGTVTIEDYNYSGPGVYGTRTVATSTYVYIHIKDL